MEGQKGRKVKRDFAKEEGREKDMGVLEFKKKKEKFMQHNHGILSGHCCLYIKSN